MTFLHDAELGDLTKGVIVPEGGVKPNILKVSRSEWFEGCNSEGCSCLLFVLRPKRSEAKVDLASCCKRMLAIPTLFQALLPPHLRMQAEDDAEVSDEAGGAPSTDVSNH